MQISCPGRHIRKLACPFHFPPQQGPPCRAPSWPPYDLWTRTENIRASCAYASDVPLQPVLALAFDLQMLPEVSRIRGASAKHWKKLQAAEKLADLIVADVALNRIIVKRQFLRSLALAT